MTYNDTTYCASPNCQNKCGRKMSADEKSKMGLHDLASYAYFCDEDGEVPHNQTQRAKVVNKEY